MSARGRDTRDVQCQAWGLLDQAESLLPLGRTEEAFAMLESVMILLRSHVAHVDHLWAHGLMAVAQLRRGDAIAARREAELTLELMKRAPPTAAYTMEGYAGAAETFLHLWERGDASAKTPALESCRTLRAYARAMPLALPRERVCEGWAHWLRGRRRAAHRAWAEGAEAADRLRMPYERARAELEIGRHLDAGDPTRRRHLESARAALERRGAAHDLSRLRAHGEIS